MGALRTKGGEKLRGGEIEKARCAWLLAADLAAHAVGADVRQVMQTRGKVGRGSDAVTARARKIACYLATVVADVTGARLSDASGIDRATIHTHCAWVEDERSRPEFDALVDGLERSLVDMAVRVVMARLAIGPGAAPGVAA
jgi:hypothetical protein